MKAEIIRSMRNVIRPAYNVLLNADIIMMSAS